MKIFQNALFIGLLAVSFSNYAQNSDSLKHTPVQITFAYPVASNGTQSINHSNNFSLNILYGVNGGLTGLELGGLVNILDGDMVGCQIGGLSNVNQGFTKGLQLAGIYNLNQKEVTGSQIGGIANLTNSSLTGFQLSGISNIARGKVNGAQLSGISNIVTGTSKGAQISGGHNLSTDTVTGTQISGINNTASTGMNGFQLSLTNYAKELNGFQLGLINIADSSNGVSIGLINLIKNGYHSVEIFGNEVLYTGVAVKSGTKEFYNIYTVGFQPNNPTIFGFGLGFGSKFNISKKLSVSADLTANYINELEDFDWKLNLLNRLDLTLDYHFNDNFSVLAGPAFNVHVSELGYENTGGFTTDIAVNPFYTEMVNNAQVQMWVGGKLGVRYSF